MQPTALTASVGGTVGAGVGGNVVGTAVGKSVGSTVGSSVGTYVYHTARGSVAPGTASDMSQEVSAAPSDKSMKEMSQHQTEGNRCRLGRLDGHRSKTSPRCVLRRGSSGATTCVKSAARYVGQSAMKVIYIWALTQPHTTLVRTNAEERAAGRSRISRLQN